MTHITKGINVTEFPAQYLFGRQSRPTLTSIISNPGHNDSVLCCLSVLVLVGHYHRLEHGCAKKNMTRPIHGLHMFVSLKLLRTMCLGIASHSLPPPTTQRATSSPENHQSHRPYKQRVEAHGPPAGGVFGERRNVAPQVSENSLRELDCIAGTSKPHGSAKRGRPLFAVGRSSEDVRFLEPDDAGEGRRSSEVEIERKPSWGVF